MKLSATAVQEQLLWKSQAGEGICFRRLTCELAKNTKELDTADLLLLDHTSGSRRFHPAAELLPLANANETLLENAELYRDVIGRYPTIAGVCGTDPFRISEKLLEQIKARGFIGVQNSPSIGLIDGKFRAHLEHSRISYDHEVAMLKLAKEMELLTVGTVFSEGDAQKMIAVGADILVVHPGPKGLLPNCRTPGMINLLLKRISSSTNPGSRTVLLPWSPA